MAGKERKEGEGRKDGKRWEQAGVILCKEPLQSSLYLVRGILVHVKNRLGNTREEPSWEVTERLCSISQQEKLARTRLGSH